MTYDKYGVIISEIPLITQLAPESMIWYWTDARGGRYHGRCLSDSMRESVVLTSTWRVDLRCERCGQPIIEEAC